MFSNLILKKLREDDAQGISVYDVFVQCATSTIRGYSQQEVETIYARLRREGYIVQNEIDICVYVTKVSNRHKEKFHELYRQLFSRNILRRHTSLIVWGCGCGLDLLALYDESISERDPELWLNLQNITLIDISPVALECAKDIAVALFPNANVKAIQANLKDASILASLREKVLWVDAFLPCVHLLSNLLDLLNATEMQLFASAVLSVSYRYRRDGKRRLLDDTYVAFSPTYNDARKKMGLFKSIVSGNGIRCTDITDLVISNCAYCWFTAISSESAEYKALFAPMKFIGDLRSELALARSQVGDDVESIRNLSNDFSEFVKCNGSGPLSQYDAVELRWITHNTGERQPYIVLYPSQGSNKKILIAFSGKDEKCKWLMIREWAAARLSPDKCEVFRKLYDSLNPLSTDGHQSAWRCSEFFRYIEAVRLGAKNNGKFERSDTEGGDLSTLLFYKTNPEINPLPELSAPQRAITVDRKQLRKIRGGPGTGKSVTMLWRAVKTVERTHLPVVILCKTNSLFSYMRQMLANTMLASFGVNRVRRELVQFSTVASFICDQVKNHSSSSCQIHKGMTTQEVNRKCAECKQRWCNAAESKTRDRFGAIFVDEMQIQDPDEIVGVFNAAMRKNPDCDFYAFCDEQQAFRGGSVLENGVEGDRRDRLVVKMPAGGFGRYKTLKTGFRFLKSPKIRGLCAFIQSKMANKYDTDELMIGAASGESNLIAQQLACERIAVGGNMCERIGKWMRSVFCGMASVPAKCALIFDAKEAAVKTGDKEYCGIPKSLLDECHFTDVSSTHNSRTENDNEVARRMRTKLYDRTGTFACTTIDCAQGQTFANVILVLTSSHANDWETLFTGVSRASERLLIIDNTQSGWVFTALTNRV